MKYFFILSFFIATYSYQAYGKFEFGMRSSYTTLTNQFQNSFLYYAYTKNKEDFFDDFTIRKNFNLRVFDPVSSDELPIFDTDKLSFEFLKNDFSFEVGFLKYRFSESFGVQLLDIANPRDYSEFIFNDLSKSKKPVFGLNSSKDILGTIVEFYLTLWANGDRLPYQGSYYDLYDNRSYKGGEVQKKILEDPEYGLRSKSFFSNSINLSFLYYHHEHRPLFFEPILKKGKIELEATKHMVDSFGTTMSYIYRDYVLRGDALLTVDDLYQERVKTKKENHFKTLVGADKTFEFFTLGLQSFIDYNLDFNYLGGKFELNFFDSYTPSLLFFKDIRGADTWFQIKNLFNFKNMNIEFNFDSISSSLNGANQFSPFRNNSRFYTDISFGF